MNTSDTDPRDERLSDPGYERLRAIDPAATTEPDLAVIKAKVDATTAQTTTAQTATAQTRTDAPVEATPALPDDASEAPVVDLAARRSTRRPPRWLQVAAAAVGVVAVGAGAFVVGQQTADAPVTADATADAPRAPVGTPEPGILGSAPAGPPAGPVTEGGFAVGAEDAATQSKSAGMTVDTIVPGSGRTVFTSSGLSQTPASGQAWGFDAASTFSAESAARLAAALGVSGAPMLSYGSWHVGSTDWATVAVDLTADGLSSFYFTDPAHSPWDEASTTSPATPEAATAALTDAMTALGVDPASFEITVDDVQDLGATSVTATRLESGSGGAGAWSAMVTTDGLFSLAGSLAPLVDLGTYDVVSPQAAVERLSDERFGATPDYSAYAATDMGIARDEVSTLPAPAPDDPAAIPALPGVASPGSSFAWPVANVTITAATLGTGTYYQPDGSVALLPTYTLTGSDGSTWTVVALADAHLDFAATS